MKRRLLIVAMFLLAGAVVNVAVAWGTARWGWGPEITIWLRSSSGAAVTTIAVTAAISFFMQHIPDGIVAPARDRV